jgi:hypothetical protein
VCVNYLRLLETCKYITVLEHVYGIVRQSKDNVMSRLQLQNCLCMVNSCSYQEGKSNKY